MIGAQYSDAVDEELFEGFDCASRIARAAFGECDLVAGDESVWMVRA